MTKFIFVTGGVVSSLGKGITAASIGALLKARGLKVFMQKFDPYINVDPGRLSPLQHGEIFVTTDGSETDLDLGHYERFIDEELTKESSITAGKIYSDVLNKERKGLYNGSTVQVIPHITDEIKSKLIAAAKSSNADVIITEIGGTVGDIESLPFLEAIRQARRDFGFNNTLYIHTTLVPYLNASKEIKTKPTQHSIKDLRSLGIIPDFIVLRSEVKITDEIKEKIALFCDVLKENVYESLDVEVLYELIELLKNQGIDQNICKHFNIPLNELNLEAWLKLVKTIKSLKSAVEVAIVGKYVALKDAYLSIYEALYHAGYSQNTKVNIKWLDSSNVTKDNVQDLLAGVYGILVPGGFGKIATEGKIVAIRYARENNIPFLGICYGMELAVIEYANNVLKLEDSNSTEIDENPKNPVIIAIKDKKKNDLRIGSFECEIRKNTKAFIAYQNEFTKERQRHRYEFNIDYLENFENDDNFIISGYNGEYNIVEIIELKKHRFFLATQFHPEFLSRPLKPHPLFVAFIKSVILYKKED